MPRPRLLVSACLLGVPCRYDGKAKPSPQLLQLVQEYKDSVEVVRACPEMLGNLGCPRAPCEIRNSSRKVVSAKGSDTTASYVAGAQRALDLCQHYGIKVAILKENSPSCGSGLIYDGTFSSKKIKGMGITTELLMHNGICVFNENKAREAFIKVLQNKE